MLRIIFKLCVPGPFFPVFSGFQSALESGGALQG
jgi:hypothetical protein